MASNLNNEQFKQPTKGSNQTVVTNKEYSKGSKKWSKVD